MIFYLAALQQMLADARRGGGARGRLALVLLPPRAVPAADADDAVRARQRGHQRLPHGRPPRRHDARRSRQRHLAAALYIYEVGFTFWDTAYAAALTVILLVLLALMAAIQYGWLERRVHYR